MLRSAFVFSVLLVSGSSVLAQDSLQFKPNDEFEARIDLSFRKRESEATNTFQFDQPAKKKSMDTPLAFLVIHFKLLKVNDDVKMKILQGHEKRTTKIKQQEVIKLSMGFIEDIKSKGEPTHVILRFLNDQKKETCQVVFTITEDGTFSVNGEKRGKF